MEVLPIWVKNMERKSDIRKNFLEKRRLLSEEQRMAYSEKITTLVSLHSLFLNATSICTYVPFREEVDTRMLIQMAWKQGKKVYVPRVRGEGVMDFYVFHDFDELEVGYQGILEPKAVERNKRVVPDQPDVLMLLPGVAFDKKGHRMGYGKGYYDRYLQEYSLISKMGLAFYTQCTDEIPAEPHDVLMHVVMNEQEDYLRAKREEG